MLHRTAEPTLKERVATLEANTRRNARVRARAEQLVEQAMPRRTSPVPRGFYDFRAGIERAAYKGRRDNLIKLTIAELQAQGFGDEHWQADYDAALADLSRPAVVPTFADAMTRRQTMLDDMAARRAAWDAQRGEAA